MFRVVVHSTGNWITNQLFNAYVAIHRAHGLCATAHQSLVDLFQRKRMKADMNMYEYSEYVYAYNVWMYITKYAYTVLEN